MIEIITGDNRLVDFWFLTQLFSEAGALAMVQSVGVAYNLLTASLSALMARVFEPCNRHWRQRLE